MSEVRINKFLSEAGVCSRREADRLIEQRRVTVNGRVAVTGERVTAKDCVCVDTKVIQRNQKPVLLAFHKPKGIVCTTSKKERNNIVDYIRYPERIYPMGRLDKDSQGLILLTNQGDLVNQIMRAGNMHEKEYEVTVDRPVTPDFLKGMAQGVPLEELQVVTRPCKVRQIGKNSFCIILTQGYNRQIRRMCEYFGYRVTRLNRIRIMNIRLGSLEEGTYRELTPDEWSTLQKELARADTHLRQ